MLGLAAVLLLVRTGGAAAFPFLDSTSDSSVPQGTELASPDAQDLRNQLQLVNGLGAPAGGGWTIVPRIDWQEMLTDNALQANSPRQADVVTFLSPGISIAGDMPRVQLTFDYAPTLALYARTTDLNSLTQQMNGLGTVTLVPDLAVCRCPRRGRREQPVWRTGRAWYPRCASRCRRHGADGDPEPGRQRPGSEPGQRGADHAASAYRRTCCASSATGAPASWVIR